MKRNNKNIFDVFLEKYDEYSSKKTVDVETFYRPTKGRCIFGFGFCLFLFLFLIRFFNFSIIFLVIFIGNLLCLLYFGLNLFTKKGFVVKMKHNVPEEYLNVDNYEADDNSLHNRGFYECDQSKNDEDS